MTCDRGHLTGDTWQVTHDRWYMTGDTWHMTHSVGWTLSLKCSLLALTVWKVQCFKNMEVKDDWLSQLVNYEGVCKTDPGLLNSWRGLTKLLVVKYDKLDLQKYLKSAHFDRDEENIQYSRSRAAKSDYKKYVFL